MALFAPLSSSAAPGALSQKSLIAQTNAPANVMVLIDSSSSMSVKEAYTPTYNAPTQPACPSGGGARDMLNYISSINGNKTFSSPPIFSDIRMNAGVLSLPYTARFNYCEFFCYTQIVNGYIPLSTIGYNSGQACFQNFNSYNVQSSQLTGLPPTYFQGSFLNWYYRAAVGNWTLNSVTATYTNNLLQIKTKFDWAKEALKNFSNQQLPNVNIGVATFEPPTGSPAQAMHAQILLAPTTIDPQQNIFNTLSWPALTASGSPLSAAMAEIGAYIVGSYTGTLTVHPGQTNQTAVSANTLFPYSPLFAANVSNTSPMAYWCQRNLMFVMSNGALIAASSGLSAYFSTYMDGGTNTLNDIAKALYEMDLRPDIKDNNNQAFLNNITTYTFGFSTANKSNLQAAAAVGGGLYADVVDIANSNTAVQALSQVVLSNVISGGSIAFNSSSLQADTALYRTFYSSGFNTGDLQKVSLDTSTGIVDTSALWSFQTILQATAPSTRFMFTNITPKTTALFTSVNLSTLSTQQKNDLNQGPTAIDGLGASRINYIRGTPVSNFRVRDKILGDIVSSSPIYVGNPRADLYPNDSSYSAFVTTNTNRTPMIYIGDNSGVFHAIDANSGAEKFAYLPLNLFSNAAGAGYHYLTDPAYQHRFYINGPYKVGDAYLNSVWQTILISGEGAGGKGYFALNVTNPSIFSSGNQANIFKWEFSSNNDTDLGYTFSEPTIAKMNNGEWVVIFGNGYNSTNGIAKLFIVKLTGPSTSTWVKGTDYFVLNTASGSISDPDGLSSPTAVDLNGDGAIDRIYAGSIKGKMWSFDVSSNSASSWGDGQVLIDTGQPITAAPVITTHPTVTATSSNQPNVMVYFGTGQYLTPTDPADTATRGLYGVWDNAESSATTAQLTTQTFTTSGTTRTASHNPVDYNTQRGWMIPLQNGERSIAQPSLANTTIFFPTMQPQAASTTACTVNNGIGWVIAVDQSTGTGTEQVLDVNADNIVNDADKSNTEVVVGMEFLSGFSNEFAFLANALYAPLSNASIAKLTIDVGSRSVEEGRISVHELRLEGR